MNKRTNVTVNLDNCQSKEGLLKIKLWNFESQVETQSNRALHGFGQAKFSDGGSVLGSSQFSILPQLPPNILLDSKVVKLNPKINILLR